MKQGDTLAIMLEPPDLVYQAVFDLAIVEAGINDTDQPVWVFASSPFYGRELLRRLEGEIIFCPAGDWRLAEGALQQYFGPEISWDLIQQNSLPVSPQSAQAGTLFWAVPAANTWPVLLDEITLASAPGRKLIMVGKNKKLRRFLSQNPDGIGRETREDVVSLPTVRKTCIDRGWQVENILGVQGPLSLSFGTTGRFSSSLGREDLVDRAYAAMRENLIVSKQQANLSAMWLLHLELH
jgi:hypothetical protein